MGLIEIFLFHFEFLEEKKNVFNDFMDTLLIRKKTVYTVVKRAHRRDNEKMSLKMSFQGSIGILMMKIGGNDAFTWEKGAGNV